MEILPDMNETYPDPPDHEWRERFARCFRDTLEGARAETPDWPELDLHLAIFPYPGVCWCSYEPWEEGEGLIVISLPPASNLEVVRWAAAWACFDPGEVLRQVNWWDNALALEVDLCEWFEDARKQFKAAHRQLKRPPGAGVRMPPPFA